MTTAVWADVPAFKGGAQVNLRLQHIRASDRPGSCRRRLVGTVSVTLRACLTVSYLLVGCLPDTYRQAGEDCSCGAEDGALVRVRFLYGGHAFGHNCGIWTTR